MGRLPGAAVWLVCVALATAACTSKPTTIVTVTVAPSTSASSSTAASNSASSSASASSSPSPTSSGITALNGTCDTLLPDFDVFQAVGIKPPPGKDAFVVGRPEPDISRLAYINCRYGVTSANTPPAIEIGVSLYTTDAKAAARIAATVDDYTTNHNATSTKTSVSGVSAVMLTGGTGVGYNVPTLVAASGQRTVAVSIASSVATGQKAQTDAIALARLALNRTAQ